MMYEDRNLLAGETIFHQNKLCNDMKNWTQFNGFI